MTVSSLRRALSPVLIASLLPLAAHAQAPYDTTAFAALKWREVGPYRGGRSVAVAGSAQRPLEYWMGTTGGGVDRQKHRRRELARQLRSIRERDIDVPVPRQNHCRAHPLRDPLREIERDVLLDQPVETANAVRRGAAERRRTAVTRIED